MQQFANFLFLKIYLSLESFTRACVCGDSLVVYLICQFSTYDFAFEILIFYFDNYILKIAVNKFYPNFNVNKS